MLAVNNSLTNSNIIIIIGTRARAYICARGCAILLPTELQARRGVSRAPVAFAALASDCWPAGVRCYRICPRSFPLFLFRTLFNCLPFNTLGAFVECMRINASLLFAPIYAIPAPIPHKQTRVGYIGMQGRGSLRFSFRNAADRPTTYTSIGSVYPN